MEHPQNSEGELSSKSSNNAPISEGHSVLNFQFLTLFPEILSSVLQTSLLGKAQKNGLLSYQFTQIRDFSEDRHRTVDDTPYGGGEGMVLKADVLHSAWKSAQKGARGKTATILLSPQGDLFTQDMAKDLATYSQLIFVCGHYEGVDERFIDLCVDREVSVGNYVLTGGELPALVMADTIARLIPGVIGNPRSVSRDSLENGLLKYPQYTRPKEFQGVSVPDVLLSGNHRAIEAWRHRQMVERTQSKRPDLWQKYIEEHPGEC